MQRTRANGRRIVFEIISLCLILVLIFLDQITKSHFATILNYGQKISVIENFFYFTHVLNDGAAWSFLSGVPWAQAFFKVMTVVALIAFLLFYLFASKKSYKWLKIALSFTIGGTIGNFIDRLLYDAVVDFIGFTFGTYNFPVFNLADAFLIVGIIMIIVHLLFLDENAVLKGKNAKKSCSDNR